MKVSIAFVFVLSSFFLFTSAQDFSKTLTLDDLRVYYDLLAKHPETLRSFAAQFADALPAQLAAHPPPDFEFTYSGVTFDLSRLKAIKFDQATVFDQQLINPDRIRGAWGTSTIKVDGSFKARRIGFLGTVWDTGRVSLAAKDVRVEFNAIIGGTKKQPRIQSVTCKADFGQYSVQVLDAKERFSAALGLADKKLRVPVEKQLCDLTEQLIMENANPILARLAESGQVAFK